MDDMNNNNPQSPIPPYQPPYQPPQDPIPPYQPPQQDPIPPYQPPYQPPQQPVYQQPYQAPQQDPIQPVYQQPYQAPQQPVYQQPAGGSGKGLAVTSMVLGIIALCLFCIPYLSIPCAIVGVILGAISVKKNAPGHGMAVAGIIMSIIAAVIAIIYIIVLVVQLNSISNGFWGNLFDYGYNYYY